MPTINLYLLTRKNCLWNVARSAQVADRGISIQKNAVNLPRASIRVRSFSSHWIKRARRSNLKNSQRKPISHTSSCSITVVSGSAWPSRIVIYLHRRWCSTETIKVLLSMCQILQVKALKLITTDSTARSQESAMPQRVWMTSWTYRMCLQYNPSIKRDDAYVWHDPRLRKSWKNAILPRRLSFPLIK